MLDSKTKKTELGWLPPNNDCTGWGDKNLFNNDGTEILDDKDKAITLKCESAKCSGKNCYHISLTDAQAVNINSFIQLGNNSIVSEYQSINLIQYTDEWFDLNILLSMNVSNTWNNTINDVWISTSGESRKFGANYTSINETIRFKYSVNSTIEIKNNYGYNYYLERKQTNSQGGSFTERHNIKFGDICANIINILLNLFIIMVMKLLKY